MSSFIGEYVHLLRLALEGRPQEVVALARKNLRSLMKANPESAEAIKKLLSQYEEKSGIAVRDAKQQPVPIDVDSKLELLRRESIVFDQEPVWPETVNRELISVIEERKHENELMEMGLAPTRSILFVGPPGVGKTLAARWLSSHLERQLLTLDLAAVMSSFLGKTGNNIRAVLNYAQKTPSVLLLDEFDAIAKRRNDDSEVGELKRLVTVLLQAIDDWPANGVLIAATNHPDLLDPAVWRRFERVVRFPHPSSNEINTTIKSLMADLTKQGETLVEVLSTVLEGNSYAEVVRQINSIRRESVVQKKPLEIMMEELLARLILNAEREQKLAIAMKLLDTGLSQRRVSDITGVSRDTLRKYLSRKN
ncbi:AAA family ATPase [Paenibacillus naphthalenovorans]|uniref:ATPase n=1 Tax=Paenibacillus naphthalenovorans TaxID=162209 RepID=A0A0U2WCG2_9BACL|nr:AAA family ATPase [Paenibacillus naphthalenovorans]ALS24046.1 ATPase [Paenibacillus naphthalenovorans]SDJ75395.1 ATPase family associated with various cellular activities (AAA) [Paenibacillus naphthalenovorans]